MNISQIIDELKKHSNPSQIAGMQRFGINPEKTFAVKVPILRDIAKKIKRDHQLALQLWDCGYRETQIIASMIADPKQVSDELMDRFASFFSYWEICDQFCMNLFEKMPNAYEKALEYSYRQPTFEKRTGFVLMARLAVSDKKAVDDKFYPFFDRIMQESCDGRNDVKKGVNWALRQIGKRNVRLREKALITIEAILEQKDSVKWVATDAKRELMDVKIIQRIK
ncbi:MAG: DNA alkylation repair protein [Candidatus Riflemargulisbacteria bacterium]